MEHVVHWDEAPTRRREAGHIGATWHDLGSAAGSLNVGLQRIRIDSGRWSTPAHSEGAEEEIFFVLAGSGLSWQDGEVYEVGPGDCLVHLAQEEAHTLQGGPDGLDVLAFGQRIPHGNTILPRAGVAWAWPGFLEATPVSETEHPFQREATAGEPEVGEPAERPGRIVNVAGIEPVVWGKGSRVQSERRNLGRAAGSLFTGLQHCTVAPGKWGQAPHCHSAEEELFVVLDGGGLVELGEEEHPVGRGTVVSRPAGTGVAHAFRAGDVGLVYLAYGTSEPHDVCWYPRSRKIGFHGLGVIARVEKLDYWDGET